MADKRYHIEGTRCTCNEDVSSPSDLCPICQQEYGDWLDRYNSELVMEDAAAEREIYERSTREES